MYSDRNLRILFGAATIAVVSGTLGALAYLHRPPAPDGEPVLGTAQILVLEVDSCDWCERFRRKAGRAFAEGAYGGTAPIRYINVEDGPPPKRYRLSSFRKAPMVVLFDAYGREVDRIEGEPADGAALDSLVRRHLKRLTRA
jgi:hypothetical protein